MEFTGRRLPSAFSLELGVPKTIGEGRKFYGLLLLGQ